MLAFMLGVVAGGIAALLLAPASGQETRRRIRETSGDVYRRGRDSIEHLGEQVGLKARNISESARHQVDAVKGAVQEGKEAYRRELGKSGPPQA